ncbi:hypothetical protein E7T06_07125 [Deinococcus sp. Arct2-2]|uniref:hypothetical protein n=1 Tax=Deinococcus sp. Arct2-2 TaxID=2568653 RepID=UPI0010A4133D|nr:hypothetical protein [Deinococcus sp. Arct2-2]THF70470.1 hypothetical protein E7T06_07125 [Deinococcus sp. Arct2-2]
MTAQTCGTCRHGVPIQHGMIQCRLGWEAHDGFLPNVRGTGKNRVVTPIHMAHGELEKPEATPHCSCGCTPDKWLPVKA